MRTSLILLFCLLASPAHADWYFRLMKIECDNNMLRIIDYSEYNELGESRKAEQGVIDVASLSTWKTTKEGQYIVDKPNPYVKVFKISSGKYKVIITNSVQYPAAFPVVNVFEISNPKNPKHLIKNLWIDRIVGDRYEILFSKKHPEGEIIDE